MATTAPKFKAVTLDTPEYAIKLTRQQFEDLFGGEPRDIGVEAVRTGWNHTLQLYCIKRHWIKNGYMNNIVATTFYGYRSILGFDPPFDRFLKPLQNCFNATPTQGELDKVETLKSNFYGLKEAGYYLQGKCKVEGREVNGYISDITVNVEGNPYIIVVIVVKGES